MSLKDKDVARALAIIEVILVHGPGFVTEISKLFENGDPSAEDIRSLKITKKPEDYFAERNESP